MEQVTRNPTIHEVLNEVLDGLLQALEIATGMGVPRDEAAHHILEEVRKVFTAYALSEAPIRDLRILALM